MRGKTNRLCLALFVLWNIPVWAQQSQLESLRIWNAPERTRLVFDVTSPQSHRIFTLENPPRLVIDLSNTVLNTKLPQHLGNHSVFHGIRSAPRNKSDLRVVVDLKSSVRPQSFQLNPNKSYGYRLVVDLYTRTASAKNANKPKKTFNFDGLALRDLVVSIDAGHGGEDPGARGARGTKEKDVVLAIAKRLARLIENEPGMRPAMTRTGDYYLGLRRRMAKARQVKADLFVSIHADAFKNRNARGASVYTLSERGASSEAAKWLATRENAADLVGGIKLREKDDVLAKVLLELSQTATQEASHEAATHVLKKLNKLGEMHKRHIQKARFVVLKSPDIPSILIETAFISNRSEEKNLRSTRYQQRLATAIFKGIREYFLQNAPPGTRLAMQKHVITRGDTLSGIAKEYGVSMKTLRTANSLSTTRIRVGQILTIPTGS